MQRRNPKLETQKQPTPIFGVDIPDKRRQPRFKLEAAISVNSRTCGRLKGQTVDISEHEYKVGGISENDYLKIQLQLLQYQGDLEQALVAREQSLSDLRQLLGYESVSADYDVEASFNYQPMKLGLEDLQLKALQDRPDLRAAEHRHYA